jgi:PAS domain S-box-containing protein
MLQMNKTSLRARIEKQTVPPFASRAILFGIGGLLAAIYGVDLYQELGSVSYPLWVKLVESLPVIGAAAGILVIAARFSAKPRRDPVYLSETAKGCLVGFLSALGVGLFLLFLRQIRGGGAPMVYTLTSAGAFAGTLVGYYQAQATRVRRMLRSITDNLSEGIYRSVPGEGIVFANPALGEMLGFESVEALLEVDPASLYTRPEDRGRLRERVEAGDDFEAEEVQLKRRDGSTFIGRLGISVERDDDGEVKYYDGTVADITERKVAEEQLRERESRLRGLANSIPGIVYQFYARPDGTYGHYFVSENAEEELGISAELDGYYERFVGRVPESHREAFVESIDQAVEAEEPWRYEFPFVKPSGERIWALGTATPEKRDEELVYNGVILDITERKEERRRRKQTIRRVTDAIMEVDADWCITLVNDQAEKLFGRTEEEFLGRSAEEVFSKVEGTRFEEKYRRAMQNREPTRLEEYYGGLDEWLDVQVYPNEEGGLAFYFEEITERKKREEALLELREKYKGLLEGAPDAIFVADANSGTIIDANQAAASLLGTTVDQIIGRDQTEIHPSGKADRYRSLFKDHMQDAEKHEKVASQLKDGSQAFVETDSGEHVPVEISAKFLEIEDEEVFVGIVRDITERINREEALRVAKEEAEAASRLKSSMLANMSHEIRTPLTSIIGFAEAIGEDESSADRFAPLIEKSGKRLLETLDGVLNLSKLEAEAEFGQETVDLAREACNTGDEFRPQAETAGVDLSIGTPGSPVQAVADKGGVQIVIQNLVSNAIKYTDEGGQVWVRTYREAGQAILEIEDTGTGMDPGVAEDLFEPFRQASEGWGRKYEGSGVGLAVTKRAVEEMNGAVDVETEKGKGSRFTVRLPLADVSKGDASS